MYRLARAHTRAIRDLIAGARTVGFSDLVNQIRRSAASMTANIQEAGTQRMPAKRAYYFEIAKGSASECWGHTDNFVDFGLAPESAITGIRDLQNQIIALLTTMIRNARADAAEG
ncbi:MAG: four helix bundle protein [Gemmatimonadetes bacterium]|nr:four helix bundle protein [Gemmatimonadota bacterium]